MLFSKAFLTAVLQDYGRSQGVSLDTLTFTHHVASDATDIKDEEFSIIIRKRLNIVRRAFKVLVHLKQSECLSVHPALPSAARPWPSPGPGALQVLKVCTDPHFSSFFSLSEFLLLFPTSFNGKMHRM